MKISSTWLLTSAAQIIITIAMGAFMIINAAVMFFYALEAYDNYHKKESVDVILTGRIHKFSSLEFTTNPSGTMRTCTAITSNGRIVMHEMSDLEGNVPSGDFCRQLLSAKNISQWEYLAPTSNGSSFGEKLFWSIVFLIIFMGGAVLWTSIPANVIGILVPGIAPYAKLLAVAMTLPVLLFWVLFTTSAWTYNPSYWKSPDGYVVTTEKVFITRDNRMYTAPETLFDWTSTNTMQERKMF